MGTTDDPDTSWLPPLMELSHCGGDWAIYCERLHDVFRHDFVDSKPLFDGKVVTAPWRHNFAGEGKSGTFWHLVSQGGKELERIPDMRRCERFSWIRKFIDWRADSRLHVWLDSTRGDRRWKIALEDYSYVVILSDRGTYMTLVTAFWVEWGHYREKLAAEHLLATRAPSTPKSSKPPPRR